MNAIKYANLNSILVHYYASSLFLVWVSLVTFTMHAWCVEQRPNIEFFKKITSSEWAQKALRMAFLDVSN